MPDEGRPDPTEVLAGDETPSGTTAFLHALMSMLGEVLDRADGRLSSLEATLAAQSDAEPAAVADPNELVVAALERLSERVERLEAREPAAVDSERALTRLADLSASVDYMGQRLAGMADLMAESAEARDRWSEDRHQEMTALETAVSRLDDLSAAVDSIGYGMAGMAELMRTSSGGDEEWPEGLRAALLTLGQGLAGLRQDLEGETVEELRGAVRRLEGQLTLLTNQLAAQPGPGPALAMVAAGLAERFEERTQALTELLEAHAEHVRLAWERIDAILDGGTFDELAVGQALEHVIDNQELMADSLQHVIQMLGFLDAGSRVTTEGVPDGALEALGAGIENVGARVDDVRRRLAALAMAVESSALEPTRDELAPEEEGHDPASLFGRRASTAGRRLANDLGLRGRGRPPRSPEGGQP